MLFDATLRIWFLLECPARKPRVAGIIPADVRTAKTAAMAPRARIRSHAPARPPRPHRIVELRPDWRESPRRSARCGMDEARRPRRAPQARGFSEPRRPPALRNLCRAWRVPGSNSGARP